MRRDDSKPVYMFWDMIFDVMGIVGGEYMMAMVDGDT